MKRWYPPLSAMLAISLDEEEETEICGSGDPDLLDYACFSSNQGLTEITSCGADLPGDRRNQLHQVMTETPEIFSSSPGRTALVEHIIDTADNPPV